MTITTALVLIIVTIIGVGMALARLLEGLWDKPLAETETNGVTP